MRIYLHFAANSSPSKRARLGYAFRLFCAIYGHEPVLDIGTREAADVWICYGSAGQLQTTKPCLQLSDAYSPRPVEEPAPPPIRYAQDAETTVLFHPTVAGFEPDWLGEIFEWVSCADEYSVEERDPIGRIPFSATYAGRHGLDIRVPYANLAMSFLERALCRRLGRLPEVPLPPDDSLSHFVVSTHDVDYWPMERLQTACQLAKNSAMTLFLEQRPVLSLQQAMMAIKAVVGRNTLDQVPELMLLEKQCGISSSYYFLAHHGHRRDANYTCDQTDPLNAILLLEAGGFEVGVHGSYTSLDRAESLAEEFEMVRRLGLQPIGTRQHWLRFTLDRLIPAVERVGAHYDTSLGWSDRIGFRAGASFAFPPYNFAEERPANFMEIPLVMVDQGLHKEARSETEWCRQAELLLSVSRRYGWGGVSVLWHPTSFGGGWLSKGIGNVFRHLIEKSRDWNDTWVSGKDFCWLVRQRYMKAGLLEQEKEVTNTAACV